MQTRDGRMLLGLALALVCSYVTLTAAEVKKVSSTGPCVDVVFTLDTTGSMGGLIHAAKEKIWSIANTMASAKPAPNIRIGLIGYRDRKDTYVTKNIPLTEDLDAVYKELMGFQADGGGDAPESVNQALHEAVAGMGWRTGEQVYRVIFLVGDYPPHMDYSDDIPYESSCKQALSQGIFINTIQCGNVSETTTIWRKIAAQAKGDYFQVAQDGDAILTSSPFDAELAELAKKLDVTRVYYGDVSQQKLQKERQRTSQDIYDGASINAQAQRAVYNSSAAGIRNFAGDNELIDTLQRGTRTLADIPVDQLPENMRAMTPEARAAYVTDMTEKRSQLTDEIAKLEAKRQAFLKDLASKRKMPALEKSIHSSVQKQAEAADIQYDSDVKY